MNKNIIKYLLLLVVAFVLSCGEVDPFEGSESSISSSSQNVNVSSSSSQNANISSSSLQDILDAILETGIYTTKDSVAAYIYLFHKLPSNYVNKATGQTLYEDVTGNAFSRWNFNPWTLLGVMIGGDVYRNDNGSLPSENSYRECDVDYHDSSRGTKRLVYTLNGIVYYTANHYDNFAKIY